MFKEDCCRRDFFFILNYNPYELCRCDAKLSQECACHDVAMERWCISHADNWDVVCKMLSHRLHFALCSAVQVLFGGAEKYTIHPIQWVIVKGSADGKAYFIGAFSHIIKVCPRDSLGWYFLIFHWPMSCFRCFVSMCKTICLWWL